MKRIGIYGGTFNPPHVGHLSAAKQAAALLELDKVLLIPDNIAPHKAFPEGSPTSQQRLQMLRLAVGEDPVLKVSDLELNRPGTSYTCETILALHKEYPEDELVLLLGTDMFLSLDNWKNPQVIFDNATIGVLHRGMPAESDAVARQREKLEDLGAKVAQLENEVIPISSTDLRRMLVFECADSFLHPAVAEYIRANGLYGVGNSYKNLSLEDLEQTVIRLLNPNRVSHVLGCRDTAMELAKRWGANETDAARAGLLHDVTKALSAPLQLTLCRDYGMILNDFSQKNPKTLHALTGSLVAERVFGENKAVVEAIRHHTTGKSNMNVLEKIIYVADYMEPNRDFPGVERLRELAFSDLDEALHLGLTMTLELLKKQGSEVSPESREALAWLETKGKCKC
jgi:nicotinate-nucleotide adenylyltransferase